MAKNKNTDEIVALKKVRMANEKEGVKKKQHFFSFFLILKIISFQSQQSEKLKF